MAVSQFPKSIILKNVCSHFQMFAAMRFILLLLVLLTVEAQEGSFMEIQHSYEPSFQPVREVINVDFGYVGSVILATGMLLVQPLVVAFS